MEQNDPRKIIFSFLSELPPTIRTESFLFVIVYAIGKNPPDEIEDFEQVVREYLMTSGMAAVSAAIHIVFSIKKPPTWRFSFLLFSSLALDEAWAASKAFASTHHQIVEYHCLHSVAFWGSSINISDCACPCGLRTFKSNPATSILFFPSKPPSKEWNSRIL